MMYFILALGTYAFIVSGVVYAFYARVFKVETKKLYKTYFIGIFIGSILFFGMVVLSATGVFASSRLPFLIVVLLSYFLTFKILKKYYGISLKKFILIHTFYLITIVALIFVHGLYFLFFPFCLPSCFG